MRINSHTTAEKGILVRCPNSDCTYLWRYAGRFILYATCPSCRRNIKILENAIKSPQSVQVSGQGQTAAVRNTIQRTEESMCDD
jgi:hypothetical protein